MNNKPSDLVTRYIPLTLVSGTAVDAVNGLRRINVIQRVASLTVRQTGGSGKDWVLNILLFRSELASIQHIEVA
jgi:hypothetical protein